MDTGTRALPPRPDTALHSDSKIDHMDWSSGVISSVEESHRTAHLGKREGEGQKFGIIRIIFYCF